MYLEERIKELEDRVASLEKLKDEPQEITIKYTPTEMRVRNVERLLEREERTEEQEPEPETESRIRKPVVTHKSEKPQSVQFEVKTHQNNHEIKPEEPQEQPQAIKVDPDDVNVWKEELVRSDAELYSYNGHYLAIKNKPDGQYARIDKGVPQKLPERTKPKLKYIEGLKKEMEMNYEL